MYHLFIPSSSIIIASVPSQKFAIGFTLHNQSHFLGGVFLKLLLTHYTRRDKTRRHNQTWWSFIIYCNWWGLMEQTEMIHSRDTGWRAAIKLKGYVPSLTECAPAGDRTCPVYGAGSVRWRIAHNLLRIQLHKRSSLESRASIRRKRTIKSGRETRAHGRI